MSAPPEVGDVDAALRGLVREALGRELTRIEPLPAGLGLRRFFRLQLAGDEPASAIARVEAAEDPAGRPTGVPPEPPLEPLRGSLEAHGIPVPARLGGDPAAGIELLEDVGDLSLEEAVRDASPEAQQALYREAVGLVPRIQSLPPDPALPAFARRLDRALLRYKAELFARWSLPAALGREPRASETQAVHAAFERVADAALEAPQRLAHRDYQSQNLHLRPGGGLVLLDVQGAFLAPPEYDLACLLRDSYVELPESLVQTLLAEVRPALPDAPDPGRFAARFDLLALARKAKDHARFLYAARTRDDARWLEHVPVTVRHLRRAAEGAVARDPAFADLAGFVTRLPEDPCAR